MNIPALDAIQFDHHLHRLARNERGAQVEFLIALAEFDRRSLYLELGFSSLWAYCLDGLHFDEGQVNLRTRAIHLLQRFPALIDPLRDFRLSLSTLVMLTPVITEANTAEFIERAAYKTKSEVEKIVVSIRPIEVKQEGFRMRTQPSTPAPVEVVVEDPAPVAPPPAPRPLQPVAAEWTLFRARLSNPTVEALQRAVELASHRIKPGDWDALLGQMARVFCDYELKRVAAQAARPRQPARATTSNKQIPAAVRREIWQRDDGRCTFVGADGRRCNSRWRVQYHHLHPAGQGGPATVDNIRIRCERHNQYEAELVYGKDFMDAKRKGTTPGNGATDHTETCGSSG